MELMPRILYQVRPFRVAWLCILCRKYYVTIALLFAAFYILPTTHYILLAATPLETAQSDYNFEFSKFRDAQDKYTRSKQSYISFKTAAAKDQAYIDSKAYLNQAINLELSYLALINEYINSLQWQNDKTHQQVVAALQSLKTAYLQQEQSINTSQTLEDLQSQATSLSQKQQQEIDPAVYWIIVNLELTRARQLQMEFEKLSTKLGQNQKAFPNATNLSNWQSEIQNISKASLAQIQEAQKQMERMTPEHTTEWDTQTIADFASLSRKELKKAQPFINQAAKYR